MHKFYRSFFLAALFAVACFSAALADDYILPVTVDGHTYTLTVSVQDGTVITATTIMTGVSIGEISTTDAEPVATATAVETAKPAQNEITCQEILDSLEKMTRAQWMAHIGSGVKTKEIIWEGTIDRVDEPGWFSDKYPVWIDVAPGCRIRTDLADRDLALSLDSEEAVRITATIDDLVVTLGQLSLIAHGRDRNFKIEVIGN